VRRTVDLDDQPSVARGEVGDEAATDNLTSKAKAGDLFASKTFRRRRSAFVALRLSERATGGNLFCMTRPPP
jgi:hypothetical protein